MQALGHIAKLLEVFHTCSREIRPLSEEDLLFLLLSRFAEQSGSIVYAEIQRSQQIQIYDSTIAEPLVSRATVWKQSQLKQITSMQMPCKST